MDFATRFVLNLKSYFDVVPTNVWYDFERNLLPDRTWDEDSILRTSILRDGLDKPRQLREANNNPVYNLEIKSFDYGGKRDETITGADLAVIFRLEINRTLVTQRVVLVQLKRAFFDSGRTTFPALHHRSGKKYYGNDFHQAQKMLFFSTTPVYWFATTSAILDDETSLTAYSQQSNLSQLSKLDSNPSRSATEDLHQGYWGSPYSVFGTSMIPALASLSPDDLEEYFELLYHRFPPFYEIWHHLGRPKPGTLKRDLEHAKDNLPYQYWQLLRNRLQQFAYDNYGMPQRIGLFVCNAEDIYTLSHSGNHRFTDLYSKSIPFTQFMLRHMICNDFGDSNSELIEAILNRDIHGYFRERIQQIANRYDFQVPQDFDELSAVQRSISLSLRVTLGQVQG